MKYITTVFMFTCLLTFQAYCSNQTYSSNQTYCSNNKLLRSAVRSYNRISFEEWAEMSRLNISYKELLEQLRSGKRTVNFDEIFDKMEVLTRKLPSADGSQQQYQKLIESHRQEVALEVVLLKKSLAGSKK